MPSSNKPRVNDTKALGASPPSPIIPKERETMNIATAKKPVQPKKDDHQFKPKVKDPESAESLDDPEVAEPEMAVAVEGPEEFRFRTKTARMMFSVTVDGESKIWRAKGHILTVKADQEGSDKLLRYLNSDRKKGYEWKALIPGEAPSQLIDSASVLEALMNMDTFHIYQEFKEFELESLNLDLNSTKAELITGFQKLEKTLSFHM